MNNNINKLLSLIDESELENPNFKPTLLLKIINKYYLYKSLFLMKWLIFKAKYLQ